MKNPLSLEAFADWCERKPADEEYNYASWDNCACAQYATSLGMFEQWKDTPIGFWCDIDDIACEKPRTFGALASRLRSELASAGE